jgi:uncharacterized protein (TIGR00369 family)
MSSMDWQSAAAAARARSPGPGVSPIEVLRAQSGLEFLQAMIDGRLPRPPICDVLNFQLIEVGPGRGLFQGIPQAEFYNPLGSVHGGWSATLLDSCMGVAVHTTLAVGQGYTTVEFKLNLVRQITRDTGPLRAEGKVVNAGRTIATSEGRLFGPDGKLYAHGTETCLIFPI